MGIRAGCMKKEGKAKSSVGVVFVGSSRLINCRLGGLPGVNPFQADSTDKFQSPQAPGRCRFTVCRMSLFQR